MMRNRVEFSVCGLRSAVGGHFPAKPVNHWGHRCAGQQSDELPGPGGLTEEAHKKSNQHGVAVGPEEVGGRGLAVGESLGDSNGLVKVSVGVLTVEAIKLPPE